MRRPPSLSESHLSDYKFLNDKPPFNEILVRDLQLSINDAIKKDDTAVENIVELNKTGTLAFCNYAFITEYLLRFLLHISMISFFETLFFFQFVSKDEDDGISYISKFYINKVTSSCSNINSTDSYYINMILGKFVNSTLIIEEGKAALLERTSYNNQLNKISWFYFAGLNGGLLLLIVIALIKNYKIRWSYLFFENLMFVSMLGLYEFMFFETIIKKYVTLTPAEISMQFIKGLQSECGLLLQN